MGKDDDAGSGGDRGEAIDGRVNGNGSFSP
jgi:hypothetical protein